MTIQEETSKMEVSPYLSSLQSLKGQTASEKYKELHSVAAQILKNDEEKTKFLQTGITDRVPAILCPTMQILIGMRLKSNEAVINALKSNDSSINKQGLKAKWFFKASNSFIEIKYLVKELLPFISLQTRLVLIKKLGKCLKTAPEKADTFFQQFVEFYGIDQTLPLLFACTEDFIYQEILRRKIILSVKMLMVLYNRYPQLAIRYLQLGNENNKSNLEDRLAYNIRLAQYSSFFSALMKNHLNEFVEFYSCFPEQMYMDYQKKFGNTGTKLFLKNAVDTLIHRPRIFLPILSLKVVTEKLSDEQFTAMFKNLLPEKMEYPHFKQLLYYLKYYPEDKAYELLSKCYQMVYGSELLDFKDILKIPDVTEIMPLDMKVELFKEYVKDKPDSEAFMQLKDSFPLLKEKIDNADDDMKAYYVSNMIYSCRLYKDKEGLLEALKYFNSHLKNESAAVLQSLLERLYVQIDLSMFEKEHWKILGEIIQRGYITGALFIKVKNDILELDMDMDHIKMIDCALIYFLKQCQTNDANENDRKLLDTIVNVIIEYYCEHSLIEELIPKSLKIQKDCLHKFLLAVPLKYPENHDVWKKLDKKIKLTSYLIDLMIHYNKNTKEKTKISIQDYPWLKNFSTDLLKANSNISSQLSRSYAHFKESLRCHDLDFYQNIIDGDTNLIYEVTTNDALIVLKKDAKKVLNKWTLYLSACKEGLLKGSRATRRFVASIRWHQDLPLKFAEQCLKEMDDQSNLLVLAVLLEGDAFAEIIKPFLPKEMEVDCDVEDAKKSYRILSILPRAFELTNPPVSMDILASLCQDNYSSIAMEALTSVASKIPVDCVITFASKLMDESESKKNFGIHLMFQVAQKPEVRKLLSQIVKDGKCLKDKKMMAEMVFHLLTQTPCEETWQMMKSFIKLLSAKDESIFNILQNFKLVSSKYVSEYLMDLFMRINELTELTKYKKTQLIKSLVNQLKSSTKMLSEDVLSYIVKEHFFYLPYDFLFDNYLFSDPEKFEKRLDLVVGILSGTLTQLNEPDSKKSRLCPAITGIHKLFSNGKLFDHFIKKINKVLEFNFPTHDDEKMKLRFINRILEIPSVKDDLSIYVKLNIYKIYFKESDPKKFGETCGKNVKELTDSLDKELVVHYYGDALRNLVNDDSYRHSKKFSGKALDVIDGMKSYDLNVSNLIGVKVLDSSSVQKYDKICDAFIDIEKRNPILCITPLKISSSEKLISNI